jgi:hypothetical protein
MRTLIISAALLSAFAAHAEPKRSATEPAKPAAAQYQPKVIEAKPIELATPELEIKTKDVSDAALDKKLAKRKTKAQSGEANVLREPAPLKLEEAAPAAAASATATAKP